MTNSELPPCVVLGLETQIGLNVVRELGRAGVKVIGVAQNPDAIGLRSRYLWKGVVATPPRSSAMIQTLQRIGNQYGPCPLISIAEVNMLWLQHNAAKIFPLKPVLPRADALAAVLDKRQTFEAARAVEINVPRTWQPLRWEEIEAEVARFPFPAVLKWADANDVASDLAGAGIEFIKSEYAESAEELIEKLNRYVPIGKWPLVQQYCAGYGIGQFFYIKGGHAIRRFQHRRVAEWPPEGGVSSVSEAVSLDQHLALQEKSIALLRRLGWQGVAMVEYRHDSESGQSWLMEINGRFWGSFPLATQAGAAFAYLTYLDACGVPLPDLPPPAQSKRCRMISTEVKRLVRIWLRPKQISDPRFAVRPWSETGRFILDFVRPGTKYYVWDWDDPLPWFKDIKNLFS